MNDLPRTILRGVLLVAAVALSMTAWWLWIPMGLVAGFAASRLLSGSSSPRAAGRAAKKEARKLEKQQEKTLKRERKEAVGRYYDKREGWRAESLPYDMSVGRDSRMSPTAFLDVAGMRNAVVATAYEDGVRFSLNLKDDRAVSAAEKAIRDKRLKARLVRGTDGVICAVSGDPFVISALAKEVYPSKEVSFGREVTHSRQYVVEGCESYEEALEKFEYVRDTEECPVRNSFVSVKETVGGQSRESSAGKALDKASVISLPSGAYVITESSVTTESAVVKVPGDITKADDIRDFASAQVLSGAAERESTARTVLGNGTPEGVAEGDKVEISPVISPAMDSLTAAGLKAYVVADTPEEVARISEDGRIPKGTHLSVGKDVPSIPGKYVVAVDINNVSDMLKYRMADNLLSAPSDGEYVTIAGKITSEGYASVVAGETISLDGAVVNGVLPVSEVRDRTRSSGLDRLESAELADWMEDAGKIERVDITIDARKAEMRITSQVGGVVKTESRSLCKEELGALNKRGSLSSAEMKDFLMQTHPDYFKTYRAARSSAEVPARSVYKDPWRDFLAGRKPERALSAENVMRQARQKRAEAKAAKQAAGHKPVAPKMKRN